MINEKKSVFIIFLFCFYVYSFSLSNFPMLGHLLVYLIPLIYISFNIDILKKTFVKPTKFQYIWLGIYAFLVVLSIVLPLLYNTNDFTYIVTITFILRRIIVYLFLMFVIIKKYGKAASIEMFMYYYCWATICYVLFTMIMVAIPPLKNVIMGIVSNDFQNELLQNFGYATRIGWMGFSGFRATIKCSISVCFITFLAWNQNSDLKIKKSFMIATIILSLLGNMFYGRIGIAVSVIVIIIALLMYRLITRRFIIKVLFVIVLGYLVLLVLKNYNSSLNDWYIWMTTPFKNFFETGSFNNKTVNMMTNEMLFLPKFKTILIGDALYTVDNHYYMQTDLGFMRNILFWGLPGLVLSYSLVFLPKMELLKKYNKLLILIFISFIILEYKGEVYYEFAPFLFVFGCFNTYLKRVNSKGGQDE